MASIRLPCAVSHFPWLRSNFNRNTPADWPALKRDLPGFANYILVQGENTFGTEEPKNPRTLTWVGGGAANELPCRKKGLKGSQ